MSRGRAALVLAAFVASLAWVALTPWCTRDRASADDFVAAARAAAIAEIPPGSLVLVHPPWRDDAVAAVRAAGVVADPAAVTSAFAPRHGEPWPPLVVLADADASPLPRALRARLEDERRVGSVAVARTAPGVPLGAGDAGTRDLSDGLAAAEVEVVRGAAVTRCSWSPVERRHRCPGMPEWVHVGVEELPVNGRAQRCTWAHPITDATLVVRFPAVPLQGALTLELALTDGAADNAALAPVRAALLVDGAPALELLQRPGRRGFTRGTAAAGARDAQVELRLTTPNDGQRHTCFRLTTGAGP
ncbi:MAG: hypothetical protein HYS27_21465 [Deltaproteobacteria bacterium]|nr:hypothetical protein [Deltaproteobacteria bacterium]